MKKLQIDIVGIKCQARRPKGVPDYMQGLLTL